MTLFWPSLIQSVLLEPSLKGTLLKMSLIQEIHLPGASCMG